MTASRLIMPRNLQTHSRIRARPVYNRPFRMPEFLFLPERRHLYLGPIGPGTRSVFLPGDNRAPLANSCSQDACDLLVPKIAAISDSSEMTIRPHPPLIYITELLFLSILASRNRSLIGWFAMDFWPECNCEEGHLPTVHLKERQAGAFRLF